MKKDDLSTPFFVLYFLFFFVLLGVRGGRCQRRNYVESVCLATFSLLEMFI